MLYREIGITDIDGVLVGHAQRKEMGSGCTAVLVEKGALCGCDVRGGSPATRDTQALRSEMSNQKIYGVVLTGGSAYGLNTCTGVMNYLTERGAGTMVRSWRIPVVVGASIFDFPLSDGKFIPGTELGYEAAKNASSGPVEEGCVGGGTGASVSKFLGPEHAFKSGIGTYGLQVGDLKVAALVNVNAFGDIYDSVTGKQLTGPLTEDRKAFRNTVEMMIGRPGHDEWSDKTAAGTPSDAAAAGGRDWEGGNTTVGLIVTNAKLTKSQMNKVASVTHNGLARAIRPVHTTKDGDTVFAMTTAETEADVDLVGVLAAEVMAKAIARAVRAAEPVKGYAAARDYETEK